MEDKYARRVTKHDNLVSILIEIEDILDTNDIYVFKNWEEGEIHSGPEIKRYWVDVTLLYLYENMPDPKGAERLVNIGIKVRYEKVSKMVPVEVKTEEDLDKTNKNKPKMRSQDFWLIHLSIPRKFIEELDDEDLNNYEDETEVDTVSDARDENIDADDEFKDEEDTDTEEETDEENL